MLWRIWHRTIAILAITLWFACASASAGGKHAAMVFDANSGQFLLNEDGDAPRHPASLTKMMTLYLTFETVESGRLSMSDRVVISEAAASVAPSKLGLDPGQDLSVAEAVKALITKSANDVAVALAERIGGSHSNFVRLMNTRARELGMTRTNFENASGLPNDDQITTARDMIMLGLALQDHFPGYFQLFSTRAFAFRGKSYRNHNTMLNNFSGIDGIKTGYTRASGFNLVSSVRRSGRHVVAAVFGGASAASRNGEMRRILTKALARAATRRTRKASEPLVAKLKLKAPPKVAARPKREPAERPVAATAAAQPPPVVKPFAQAAAAQPTPPPVTRPVAVAVAEAVPGEPTPIEVFKVKPVLVKPATADETTDMPEDGDAIAAALRRADRLPDNAYAVASAAPTAPPASITDALKRYDRDAALFEGRGGRETSVPKSTLHEARVASAQVTGALVPASADGPATYRPDPARMNLGDEADVASAAQRVAAVEPALAPSTLDAQAQTLAFASQGFQQSAQQAKCATDNRAGDFVVQIGAYSSIDEAQQALTAAQGKAGSMLQGHASVTAPFQKDGRILFRARFTGFEQARASQACSALKRRSVNCFVASVE